MAHTICAIDLFRGRLVVSGTIIILDYKPCPSIKCEVNKGTRVAGLLGTIYYKESSSTQLLQNEWIPTRKHVYAMSHNLSHIFLITGFMFAVYVD